MLPEFPLLLEPLPETPLEDPLFVELPGADPELPGGFLPPGAPFSQPLCLPGFCSRRSKPRFR